MASKRSGSVTVFHTDKPKSVTATISAEESKKLLKEDALKKEKKAAKRKNVAAEILGTEESYVKSINSLVESFLKPLDPKSNTLLSQHEHEILFGNIMTILSLNTKFLGDLRKRLTEDTHFQKLGDLFLDFVPFFKMYSTYTTNHEMSTDLLNQLEDREQFTAFIAKATQDRGDGQTLASLLIMPIQRIPRYRLLLEELLKNTEPDHPDFGNLTKALELVKTVAVHVNEEVRLCDQRNKVRQIQRQFTEDPGFVEVGRRLVKQGPLCKKSRRGKDLKYEFFLFNDIFVYADKKTIGKTTFKLHRKIPIDKLFQVIESGPQITAHKDSKIWADRSMIINSSDKSFILIAATPEEREEWISAFRTCIEELKQKIEKDGGGELKSAAPVWTPDTHTERCPNCDKEFNLMRRRHHCRNCGGLTCDDCSKQRRVLKFSKTTDSAEERVCDKCARGTTESEQRDSIIVKPAPVNLPYYVEDIQIIKTCCTKTCEYHIKVPAQSISVIRTYKDFLTFDGRIREKIPKIPRLPPPEAPKGHAIKLSLIAVEKKKAAFNEYFQGCSQVSHQNGKDDSDFFLQEIERFVGFKI